MISSITQDHQARSHLLARLLHCALDLIKLGFRTIKPSLYVITMASEDITMDFFTTVMVVMQWCIKLLCYGLKGQCNGLKSSGNILQVHCNGIKILCIVMTM